MGGSGRSTLQESVDVSDRLNHVAARFQQTYAFDGVSKAEDSALSAPSREARLSTDIASKLQWIGNGTDLERMVGNLLENARRYGKTINTPTAHIYLRAWLQPRTAKEPGYLRVAVSDQGQGVPPEKLESLKKPFMRMDEARGVQEGAGLGLAIVERIAQRHGGQLELSLGAPAHNLQPGRYPRSTQGFNATLSFPLAAKID